MPENVSLGCIGGGFIGSAHAKVFSYYTNVKIFDLLPERRTHNLQEVLDQDIILVGVNTPMEPDGTVNIDAVQKALEQIQGNLIYWKPVIVKSTIPPFQMQELINKFQESMYLIFSPEFLTEKTAEFDLQQSNRFIFGIANEEIEKDSVPRQLVDELFHLRFPAVPRYWVSYRTASLVKYFTNTFFSNKVAIFNEFYQIAKNYGVSWEEVISLVLLDTRIGRSHFQVPGHDGKLGFGGHCFLKDINGYRQLADSVNVNPAMATAAWTKNIELRKADIIAEEFNKMIGRAITKQVTPKDIVKLINGKP